VDASAGIRRALALQFAEQGAWLPVTAHAVDQLKTVAEECRRYYARAIAIPTYLAEQAHCQNLIERTAVEYDRPDR
jgi:NADP-dependent 3-hydroxy acid dehydrogenase YdfG